MLRAEGERGGNMAKKFKLNLENIKKMRIKFHLGRQVRTVADKLAEKEPAKIKWLRGFAHRHTALMLVTFFAFVAVTGGIIFAVNYNTAYQYSYNGQMLGVVKDKDEVLKITSLVSQALTEDKDVEVTVDPEKDIKFEKISIFGSDIHVDTSEDVLRRMTYVGDINVNGYGITVDGNTAVILGSEESAEEVLDAIRSDYLKVNGVAVVEEADFIEKVDIKEINTDLDNLQSKEEAITQLKTGGTSQSMHTVQEGQGFAAVAQLYNLTEDELKQMNPSVDPAKLQTGDELLIITPGPMITMEASQLVTFEEQIPFTVEETKTADMYQGDQKITQKGVNGVRMVTSRIESKNGQVTSTTPLVENVASQPVTQKVLVGTAKRPPSVGDGKFRWPADKGTYRISSEFGGRWGRNHNGIDMACPQGTNVYAADGGVVEFAGRKGTFGNLVIINHQNGYRTYYAHNSQLLVKAGDKVYEGYHIAESGNTGRSTGPHIHFEIRVGDTPKNPRNWLP